MAEFANPKGVDCLWSYQAWDVKQLEVQNVEHTFFRMSEIDRLDYYTPVIIANNDYLKNYPEQARKFIAATAKGYEYAIANPREAADILMEENPELKVNAELVYASMEFLKTNTPPTLLNGVISTSKDGTISSPSCGNLKRKA